MACGLLRSTSSLSPQRSTLSQRRAKEKKMGRGGLQENGCFLCLILHVLLQGKKGQEQKQSKHIASEKQKNQFLLLIFRYFCCVLKPNLTIFFFNTLKTLCQITSSPRGFCCHSAFCPSLLKVSFFSDFF